MATPLRGAAGPALLAQLKSKGKPTDPVPQNPAADTPNATNDPPRPFDVEYDESTETNVVVFHTRHPNTKESNSIGTLAEHFTMVRRPHNKQSRIGIKWLYLNYNMFKYAQRSRDSYNATVKVVSKHACTTDPTEINTFYERQHWQEIMASIGERVKENEHQCLPGLDALVDTLDTLKEEDVAESKRNVASGTVFFKDLQFVYPAGCKVLSNHIAGTNIPTGLTVLWTQYTEGKTMFGAKLNFTMYLETWVTVGHHFVPIRFRDISFQYQNKKAIRGFYFVPLESCSREVTIQALEVRAEKYVAKSVGYHYSRYGEQAFYPKSAKQRGSSSAASRGGGRILVDTVTAAENFCIARGATGGGIPSWNDIIDLSHKHYKLYLRDCASEGGSGSGGGGEVNGTTNKDKEAAEEKQEATTTKAARVLTQYPSMFYENVPAAARFSCWPVVAGFSFTSKLWGVVLVDSLSDVPYDGGAFDQLVLPAARKRLIKAVVQYGSVNMNDIIRGKGEGVVFLFYGPPGCGKTLTAEAIAEMLKRPLYQVSMGELGTTPQNLEKGLQNVLQMCAKWKALVLLDEADIFVERRSESSGILRNSMVSVMLKMIEYFQGVLFLTTNRVETFDPAFQTRITAAIKYEKLDAASRTAVWHNLIVASGHETCLKAKGGDVDVEVLGQYEMNGRSIKNALRLALSLAMAEAVEMRQSGEGREGETLVLRHAPLIDTVEMCVQFSKDMNE